LILDLRGTNNATVKDVVDLRRHINSRIQSFENTLLELPHFAMARHSSKYRKAGSQASCKSIPSGPNLGSSGTPEPVKVLRQLVDQSLQDYTTFFHREINELKEQTRRLKEALVNHGGDIMTATGSLYMRDALTKYEDDIFVHPNNKNSLFKEQDVPKISKLKDMSMEARISELSSKQPLEEAFAEMTYHKGCHVLETASRRLGNLGKIHDSHMAEIDGTHLISNECQASSASTCAPSPNRLQQDGSPKRGHLLATHVL